MRSAEKWLRSLCLGNHIRGAPQESSPQGSIPSILSMVPETWIWIWRVQTLSTRGLSMETGLAFGKMHLILHLPKWYISPFISWDLSPQHEGFPYSSGGKESACNAGDPGSIPGSGRSAGEGLGYPFQYSWASLVDQLVKHPPAIQEIWVRSLGWEDPLQKGMAIQLQYSCLENSMDRGAWQATDHGVAKSQTLFTLY